ncbi:unnamed protein product [Prunus armeniaca]|uniref:Uncharacterized protein n=1 Tax=Prunus armeniaca TaxID=36596 RepID=A0A6J5WRF2_PRUAR|nr:unnamed protein product [Prunus armeniaca]
MMLVDGCFIIELLCKQLDLSPVEDDDAIFKTQRMVDDDDDHGITSLRQLACLFFQNPIFEESLFASTSLFLEEEFESSHLLETVRNFVVQPYMEVCEDMEYRTPIPSVSELREIGVKFVASDNVKYSGRYDITFRHGVMKIPPIIIREDGECFTRNLIAYEQCTQKPDLLSLYKMWTF